MAVSLSVLLSASMARLPLGLDVYRPAPGDNPMTDDKVRLGRRLFFDPLLSRDGSITCATCHQPERAFADGRTVSIGVLGRRGARNVPAVINRVYGASFSWDGRAPTLEQQVLAPIEHRDELGMSVDEVIDRLKRDRRYADAFRAVFDRSVSRDDLARALASYVRSILAGDAPIDRYLARGHEALDATALAGLRLFRGKANCTACHAGPTFTDERFHNTGVAWRQSGDGGAFQDEGRASVTGRPADRGAFKTPTLREVGRTAPYMHNGSFTGLEDVIEFYDRGGRPNPQLDPELRPLRLTGVEKMALAAFLRSLSGTVVEGAR
jgi:cytochrome c peroxidase